MVLVVDVVRGLLGGAVARQVQQVRRGREDLGLGEHVHRDVGTLEQVAEQFDVLRDFVAELAVELVAPDAAQVVTLLGEERALEVLTGRFDGLHFTGTRTAVDLEPRGLLARAQEVLG